MNDRRWAFTLGYTPSFTLADLQTGFNPQVFQSVDAGISWHNRAVTISVNDGASYGTFNSSYLFQPGSQSAAAASPTPAAGAVATPPPNLQLAPSPAQSIRYGANRASLWISGRADRRSTLSVGGSYAQSGQLGEPEQEPPVPLVVPLEQEVDGNTNFSYALNREDFSLTSALGQDLVLAHAPCLTPDGQPLGGVTCRPEIQSFTLAENLIHAFDKTTTLSIGAGPEYTRARATTGIPFTTTLYPSAQLAYAHKYARRGLATVGVNVVVAAAPDYRTGTVSQRAQADVTAIEVLDARVSISMEAGAGQTFPLSSSVAATIVRTEVAGIFKVDRTDWLTLRAGLSTQWQTQNPFGYFFSAFGFFAVTAAAPALRF